MKCVYGFLCDRNLPFQLYFTVLFDKKRVSKVAIFVERAVYGIVESLGAGVGESKPLLSSKGHWRVQLARNDTFRLQFARR